MNKGSFCAAFAEYDTVRSRLFCRMIDPGRQAAACRDIPSRPWKDLRICCYYDMTGDGLPDASIMIRNAYLSLWHVTAEKVLEDAWRNTTERKSILFSPLDRVLRELQEEMDQPDEPEFAGESPLYLLTNTDRIFGAVHMAVPAVLKRVGRELGTGYYILPSSIHECLILPDTEPVEKEELNSLVAVVNRGFVSERDVLTDHVYYYDRIQNQVRIC